MSIKTELDPVFEHGIDRTNRRIYFGDLEEDERNDVCWTSVSQAIRNLHILVSDNPKKSIELHMHSPGGDMYSMMHLVDEILACPCQVKFFGGGEICSAASVVMCVCDERNLYPNTTIMVHDGSDWMEGNHTDVQIIAAESKAMRDRMFSIYASNSHMPVNFWNDIMQRDLYLTPEETIQLGLADNIIYPKKRGNLRRSRIAKMSSKKNTDKVKELIKTLYKRTNRKYINKIDINVPKQEECDPNVIVDDSAPDSIAPIDIKIEEKKD